MNNSKKEVAIICYDGYIGVQTFLFTLKSIIMKIFITLFIVAISLTSCGKDVIGEALPGSNDQTTKINKNDMPNAEPYRIGLDYHKAKIKFDAQNAQSSPISPGKLKVSGIGVASVNGKDVAIDVKLLFNTEGRLISGEMLFNVFAGQVNFVFDRGQGSLPYVFSSMSATMVSYYEGAESALISRVSVLKLKDWEDLDKLNDLISGKIVEYECELGLLPEDVNL